MNDPVVQTNEWNCGYEDREADPRVVLRMAGVRDLTVTELVEWCANHGVAPENVRVTAAHLKWSSIEEEHERNRRIAHDQEQVARTEKWEREALERLSKKYWGKTITNARLAHISIDDDGLGTFQIVDECPCGLTDCPDRLHHDALSESDAPEWTL